MNEIGATGQGRWMGETGVWVVVFGDLIMFSLFFLSYASDYRDDPAGFAASQLTLDRTIGLCNTLLLLTSSWFVALGVDRARMRTGNVSWPLAGAIACGLGFVLLKGLEWTAAIRSGHSLGSSNFHMYYFTLSGIHLAHVLVGLAVLWLMRRHCQRNLATRNLAMVESGAVFWHLVDILWVMLFALLYLVRA